MPENEWSREELTFGQVEGVDPLPQQMQPRSMSQELRSKLWLVVAMFMSRDIEKSYPNELVGEWKRIMLSWHVNVMHKFADEFNSDGTVQKANAKNIIANGNYVNVFNFIEFISRKLEDERFDSFINLNLENSRAAYRIVEKSVVPFTTDAEAEIVKMAFQDLHHGKFSGGIAHLRNAGSYLTAGKWPDSVRESIHAVEAVATAVDSSAKTLSGALVRLEKSGKLNTNLKRGINALYDYTSDEKGIRHALLDDPHANVGEDEAIYMYGACAAFVTFLIRKVR